MKNIYWWLSVSVLLLAGIAVTIIARAAAASDKQKDGDLNFFSMKQHENFRESAGTVNFKEKEFACKDGTPVPKKFLGNVQALMQQLEVLRAALGAPITVNSGYRTETYNKRVGGAASSMHLVAKAADITAKGYTPAQVRAKIEALIKAGKMQDGGIGEYATFTHYDIGTPRRWKG